MEQQSADLPARVAADIAGPPDYRGMEILAPMVRAGTLPLRLECLKYGAGLVYGEEIIDRKIIGAQRVENTAFGTVDFVSPREKVTVFSTCAEERSRVVFQMGTANAGLATQAALLVCKDVRAIDVNMGCPKSFSVKGGMGAALLDTPELAADILKSLRRELPAECTLTCKIRMLPSLEKTRDFMRLVEQCGIAALALHMRTRDERPRDPAHWRDITQLCDAVRIPVIANGDFFTRRQICQFWEHCQGGGLLTDPNAMESAGPDCLSTARGPAALMIARGAMWNPSIFCRCEADAPSTDAMLRSYVLAAVRWNSTYQNTKWVLNEMLTGGPNVYPPTELFGKKLKDFKHKLGQSKSMAAICQMFGEPYESTAWPQKAHTTAFYRERELQKVEEVISNSLRPEVLQAAAGIPAPKRLPEAASEGPDAAFESAHDAKRARVDG
mmetsp:Transcript_155558/g.270647  ORF Transcript_155558/g.270647 Transcript_155558/m.270647 type:complete len:441 (-) Transcript_155558:38-1360(-)